MVGRRQAGTSVNSAVLSLLASVVLRVVVAMSAILPRPLSWVLLPIRRVSKITLQPEVVHLESLAEEQSEALAVGYPAVAQTLDRSVRTTHRREVTRRGSADLPRALEELCL